MIICIFGLSFFEVEKANLNMLATASRSSSGAPPDNHKLLEPRSKFVNYDRKVVWSGRLFDCEPMNVAF